MKNSTLSCLGYVSDFDDYTVEDMQFLERLKHEHAQILDDEKERYEIEDLIDIRKYNANVHNNFDIGVPTKPLNFGVKL